MTAQRAWVLLPSGNRLNLLAPDPQAWTDRDLAIGLSRTYRWSGYSAWDHPLSVAQHSLTVLELRQQASQRCLTSHHPAQTAFRRGLSTAHRTSPASRGRPLPPARLGSGQLSQAQGSGSSRRGE
jgi:hypothetical protein